MFGPGKYSESETLVGFIELQLAGIRASAYGLTDEQARATPCRSTLSIGGLVKHATYVLRQRERRPDDDAGAVLDEAGFALFMGSFALTDEATLDGTLAGFDQAAAAYLAAARDVDPGGALTAPPAPWDGLLTPTETVQRFALVHHVEEFARHAGHADVIREQLDGADAASLLMAVEGREGNDFVQPWEPTVQRAGQ